MKLVYGTDLHGERDAYDALARLAAAERAGAVLLGGDLFAYSREAAPQLVFAEETLRPFLRELRALAIPVLAIAGNVDRPASLVRLREFARAGLLRLPGTRPYRLAPPGDEAAAVEIIGYPCVPPTPYRLKDHERRDLATDRYGGPWPILVSARDPDGAPVAAPDDHLDRLPSIEDDLAAVPATGAPCVLVAHSPPWGGVLDCTASVAHAGSRALRRWIEARQPLLTLHGHLHEAPDLSGRWVERIGATFCVNPGPAASTPPRAVVADTTALPHSLRHTVYGPSRL